MLILHLTSLPRPPSKEEAGRSGLHLAARLPGNFGLSPETSSEGEGTVEAWAGCELHGLLRQFS